MRKTRSGSWPRWTSNRKIDRTYYAFRNPAYIVPLVKRAKGGNLKVLQGLGAIPTPEATAALIELATDPNQELALAAALTLNGRLPDPEFAGQLAGRGPFRFDHLELRRRLAKRAWDDRFAPQVRILGAKFVGEKQTQQIGAGAFMLQAVGTKEDAPAVLAAMDRAIDPQVNPRKDPKDNILDLPEPLRELARTIQAPEQARLCAQARSKWGISAFRRGGVLYLLPSPGKYALGRVRQTGFESSLLSARMENSPRGKLPSGRFPCRSRRSAALSSRVGWPIRIWACAARPVRWRGNPEIRDYCRRSSRSSRQKIIPGFSERRAALRHRLAAVSRFTGNGRNGWPKKTSINWRWTICKR